MPGFVRPRDTALIAVALLAAGCARQAPAPIAAAPVIPPRPVLPVQFTAVAAPATTADGGYETINHGIDPLQTMWHVRAALNVAAIGCRGPEGSGLVAAYNGMLKSEKVALANANSAVEKNFRVQYGAGWQTAHDQYMTRLYNFFAQPFAKAYFCDSAAAVASEIATTAPAAFSGWSLTALPRLEAPFLDGYRQIDAYRLASADWDARYGPGADRAMLATATLPAPAVMMAAAPAPQTAPASVAPPQIAYADMTTLIAWQQPNGATAFR